MEFEEGGFQVLPGGMEARGRVSEGMCRVLPSLGSAPRGFPAARLDLSASQGVSVRVGVGRQILLVFQLPLFPSSALSVSWGARDGAHDAILAYWQGSDQRPELGFTSAVLNEVCSMTVGPWNKKWELEDGIWERWDGQGKGTEMARIVWSCRNSRGATRGRKREPGLRF